MVDRVVITGDDDPLTWAVIEALANTGLSVDWWLAPDAPKPTPPSRIQRAATVTRLDLGQRFALANALSETTGVVHLRQCPWGNHRDRDGIFRQNLEHTGHLLTAAREAKTARFVYLVGPLAVGRCEPSDPRPQWDLGEVNLPAVQSLRLAYLEALRQQSLGLPLVALAAPFLDEAHPTNPLGVWRGSPRPLAPALVVEVAPVQWVAWAIANLLRSNHEGAVLLGGRRTLLSDWANGGASAPISKLSPSAGLYGQLSRGLAIAGSKITAGRLAMWSRPWTWGLLTAEKEGEWVDLPS